MLRLLPLRDDRRCPMVLLAALFLLLFSAASATRRGNLDGVDDPSAPERTVHEVLRAHGLPIGLLPRGVKEFRIDGEGRFEVRLERACNARFENEVHYDDNVTGTLNYGQMGALSGITAQELFLWFPVKGIRVDIPSSGLIYFDVGVIYKQFSLSLFETPPECRAEPPSPAAAQIHDMEEREVVVDNKESKFGKIRYDVDRQDFQKTMAVL
ncbi:hypothetical protein Taro_014153 [Colocasia esculenta]|uniref:DUF538 family protein n=1 Tax=Colocasia esculenta TaxID=4460 RepID=A0A843UHG5_COLES|nr:hypothetical protein [Colocasia esculenta]